MRARYNLLFIIAVSSFISLSAQVTLPIRQLDTTLMVGATPGGASVNGNGAATYSIPIFVSPGTAGLQPNISIEYNSQVSNGVLGVGWNIAGLSAITRAPKDYYHDGIIKGVDLQNDDQLEWDGNRITAYTGGSNGAEYATESARFAYIVSLNPNSSIGPNSFNITTKDGMKLAYGETADSRIEAPGSSKALIWRLNQMTDINGNYIKYYYTEINGDSYIDRIEYTGNNTTNPALAPYNVLKFTYEDRPDKIMYYVGGISISQTKRLTGIDMISETVPVRHYSFTYLPVATPNLDFEKSRLAQIQETGTLNGVSKAINPTVINWGPDNNTVSEISITGSYPGYVTKSYFSDLNGDGLTDQFVLRKLSSATYYTQWYYYQSNGTTITNTSSGNIGVKNCDGAYIADINNDGKNEILLKTTETTTVTECYPCETPVGAIQQTDTTAIGNVVNAALELNSMNLKTADSTVLNVIQSVNPGQCCNTYYYTYYWAFNFSIINNTLVRGNVTDDIYLPTTSVKIIPGQFNSDGKTDLLIINPDNNFSIVTGFSLSANPNFDTPQRVEIIDFDGDGLDEIFVLKDSTYTVFKLNESNLSFTILVNGTLSGANSANLKTGDFNGDGKTDIIIRNANDFKFSVYLSTGIGLVGPKNTRTDVELDGTVANIESDFYISDLNGDGRDDILDYYSQLATCPPGIVNDGNGVLNESPGFVKYYSKFDGELSLYGFQKIDDGLTNKPVSIDVADIDGDGIKDAALMLYPNSWPVTANFNGILYKNYARLQKYRVQTISNGLNQAAGFSYISLAAAGTGKYTKGKIAIFPVINIQPAQFVVSTLTTHAGYMNGGNYVYSVTDFSYKGARSHLQGKGYLGFDTLVSVNNLSNIKTESCYGINSTYFFRYPLAVNSYVANVAANKKTFTFTTLSTGTKRYYSYPLQDISNDLVTNTTVTHDYTFDNAGNMLTDKATFGSDAVVTTTNDYIFKGGYIYKNRLNSSIVSSVYTGQPAFATKKSFTYDTKGNCTSTIDFADQAKPITSTYAFNSYGLPVSITISAIGITSRISRTDYDPKYRMPVRTINPVGYKSSRTYDYKYGVVLSDSAANGLITTYRYDEFGRMDTTLMPEGYAITQRLAWSKTGDPTGTFYSSTIFVPGKPTTKAYYDILGRAIRSESTGFANKTIYTDVNYVPATPYGKAGMLTSQSLPYYTGETPQPVKYKYDAYGRNTEIDDRAMTNKSSYSGKTVTNTDVANRTSTKTVNALGNVTAAIDNGGSIAYLYHSSGQPWQITAAGAVTTITYDAYGRQLTLADPDAGTTRYTYNAFGELASQTDANGNKDTLLYDAIGRVTQKTLGGDLTTYVYNTSGRAIGQLASITGANGAKQEFTYDAAYGWPATVVQTIPGQASKFTTSYTYDIFGNNTKITYPETGFAVTNVFDKGTLVKVNRTSDNYTLWQLYDISSHGMPLRTVFGNGLFTNYTYDMDQLSQVITDGGMQFETYTVNHPNVGNVMFRKDSITHQYENFTYDNLDRITSTKYKTLTAQNIAYSGNGNITSKYDGGTYSYDPAKVHAFTTVTKITGSVTPPLQNITYTKFNKVNTIQQYKKPVLYSITYGPDEQRVKTVCTDTLNNTTTNFYAGSYEKDSTSATTKKIHYIMGGTGLVAVYIIWKTGTVTKDTLYYVCTDRQGSITALFKQDRKLAERYSYDAWGRRRNPTDWTDYNVKAPRLIARGYTGHEHLDGFGLINMNGRMYDPVIGRVLSPDPFVSSPNFTQGYNRYSYCLNNPLRYTDPSGYYERPSWGMTHTYYQGSFGPGYGGSIGPGSGNHWSDALRDEYGNFMIGSASSFNNMYGPGAYSIAQSLASNSDFISQWRQGLISIEKIRENGGYYVPVATQYNNSAKTWIDTPEGKAILLGGPSTIMQWVAVSGAQGGGGWLTATDHTNNGIGGFGAGMSNLGGNFRMNNSNGFSPKFYTKPNAAGKIFNGGFGIKTYNTTNWGKGIGYGSLGVSFVIGGINVTNGWQQDGHTYGANTQMALAQSSLGITGAWTGAEIGAAIGVWFGGVGAIPGAVIGGVIGGVVGGWGGSKLGETVVNNFSSY
ncbi:MAG: FG-GAP-like repeat-containing protein [Lentimicrobiaceae bacterium]|jgi:RHS repeat-associated protein